MKKSYILLIFALLFVACNNAPDRRHKLVTAEEKCIPDSSIDKPIVNVYVENSGSMAGYMNGYTNFKDVLKNYLTDIQISDFSDSLNLFFINKEIKRVGSDVNRYLEALTNSCNAATSDIALIFQNVLSNTNANSISIFVSDCIFSPEKQKDASTYLRQQQSDIKAAVAEHFKMCPTTAISVYQFLSEFNGVYYNCYDAQTRINAERPYYIWVIGDAKKIQLLKTAVSESKFKGGGVKHTYTLMPSIKINIGYAVLNAPKFGSFERDRNNPKTSIFNLEKATSGRGKGLFMFTIGMDLKLYDILLGNEYLMDTNNYSLLFDRQPNMDYKVEIEPNDNPKTGFTHNLKLTTKRITSDDLEISLCKKLPHWVIDVNDDQGVNVHDAMDKTFGIKYLIGGVYEAYMYTGEPNYFTISFKLKR